MTAQHSNVKTFQLFNLQTLFKRITIDPEICTGKPCIRGMRFPISRLLGLLASGETNETILEAYPYLEPEDIEEALGLKVKTLKS